MAALDVTDEEGIAALAANLQGQGRTLGVIINNAAVLTARDTQIEELDFQDMLTTMNINLYGPMRVVKHFLPLLTEPELSIINISSEAGSITNAYSGDYPYSISKTALNMFTQQLHVYVKERRFKCSACIPAGCIRIWAGQKRQRIRPKVLKGILDLIEKRTTPEGHFMFVDYTGKDMKI
ncbi:SDR family NAD(P)-dependent oxidoreductase [Paenibacillus pseudetheri]|uniref:C-factor n=1 Tax=Paenibacillus pseudetheri TaxID=2897682 RepID=A0ABN8FIV3_9BACL|nr:SDR family NAD(P)-dependent oxidoreductase [Paenibacillus pseudetheri]CAH1057447.1 C-factor [Paenibacillus pseudetheri]